MAAKSRSLELRHTKGTLSMFVSSQLCTKIHPIPLTPETSLSGKTALITGATTGLGLHAARHLLGLELSRLIIAVRSPEKGEKAAAQFRRDFPAATIQVWPLEMGSYESIQALARRLAAEFPGGDNKRLDIVILNAGILVQDFTLNKTTGHCEVIQVNYLSTVLLAILLLPTLRPGSLTVRKDDKKSKSTPGRLTIVSSGTAYWANLPNRNTRPFLSSFDNPKITAWDAGERYYSSKLLGHLFLPRLLDHLPSDFADQVVVNLVEPGYCKGSGLHRDARGVVGAVLAVSKALIGRTLDEGAWTYVDAAVRKGKEAHGCFLKDMEIAAFAPIVHEAKGQEVMDVLWEETMRELEFAGVRGILQRLHGQ